MELRPTDAGIADRLVRLYLRQGRQQDALELLDGLGEAQLPSKIYLDFSRYKGDLRAMPSYLMGSLDVAGVKIVNSHSENAAITPARR